MKGKQGDEGDAVFDGVEGYRGPEAAGFFAEVDQHQAEDESIEGSDVQRAGSSALRQVGSGEDSAGGQDGIDGRQSFLEAAVEEAADHDFFG